MAAADSDSEEPSCEHACFLEVAPRRSEPEPLVDEDEEFAIECILWSKDQLNNVVVHESSRDTYARGNVSFGNILNNSRFVHATSFALLHHLPRVCPALKYTFLVKELREEVCTESGYSVVALQVLGVCKVEKYVKTLNKTFLQTLRKTFRWLDGKVLENMTFPLELSNLSKFEANFIPSRGAEGLKEVRRNELLDALHDFFHFDEMKTFWALATIGVPFDILEKKFQGDTRAEMDEWLLSLENWPAMLFAEDLQIQRFGETFRPMRAGPIFENFEKLKETERTGVFKKICDFFKADKEGNLTSILSGEFDKQLLEGDWKSLAEVAWALALRSKKDMDSAVAIARAFAGEDEYAFAQLCARTQDGHDAIDFCEGDLRKFMLGLCQKHRAVDWQNKQTLRALPRGTTMTHIVVKSCKPYLCTDGGACYEWNGSTFRGISVDRMLVCVRKVQRKLIQRGGVRLAKLLMNNRFTKADVADLMTALAFENGPPIVLCDEDTVIDAGRRRRRRPHDCEPRRSCGWQFVIDKHFDTYFNKWFATCTKKPGAELPLSALQTSFRLFCEEALGVHIQNGQRSVWKTLLRDALAAKGFRKLEQQRRFVAFGLSQTSALQGLQIPDIDEVISIIKASKKRSRRQGN